MHPTPEQVAQLEAVGRAFAAIGEAVHAALTHAVQAVAAALPPPQAFVEAGVLAQAEADALANDDG